MKNRVQCQNTSQQEYVRPTGCRLVMTLGGTNMQEMRDGLESEVTLMTL